MLRRAFVPLALLLSLSGMPEAAAATREAEAVHKKKKAKSETRLR